MGDLIDLSDWTREDLTALFASADGYAQGRAARHEGAVGFVGLGGVEAVAFERAAVLLGLQPIHCGPAMVHSTPLGLVDFATQIADWLDVLVVCEPEQGDIEQAAAAVAVPVVNAGCAQARPCELLGELHALHRMGRDPFTQRIVLVGPNGPAVRSWAQAARAFGLDLVQSCPDELADPGLVHDPNLFAALRGADLVITVEPGEYAEQMAPYRVEPEYLVVGAPDCRVSPQVPFEWGRELATQLREDPHSWVGPHFRAQLVALDQAILARSLATS
ncbi:Ornithine carbamoyltransferase [Propionibacterium cyclohexanicum]|uniref:Ornithine carbamoyltransferase n=1 Tax=Propionibacterium cyclohexanicum TaxID=64702 RepID=A0A1H9SVH4_9ACTN|nr:hypothetical protein [Propionibacterium cyclohexanicum]SER89010.1 Ornithine carbamoyltransferase [Propionibacterium cyclohexanicum]